MSIEQRPRQHPRLAARSREHTLGAVQHERAVGEPGQRVVEILVGHVARRLLRRDRRLLATAAEDEDQQAEQHAQEDAADQQRERAPVRRTRPCRWMLPRKYCTVHPLCRLIVALCAPDCGVPPAKTAFVVPAR